MNDVPFINIEYIFSKIYGLLIYIKNIIFSGSVRVPSGPGSDYATGFSDLFSWTATILIIGFLVFLLWAIYLRMRIYEVDQELEGAYKGHFVTPPAKTVRQTHAQWEQIRSHFDSTNPNDWKSAILDADVLLEQVVTSLGYTGESLGAKLTSIRINDFPTLQSAWEAHKMRNKIAHEGASFTLTDRQKEITRKHFEAVFRDTGII